MTDKQKEAIKILNGLRAPLVLSEERAISEEEYFTLLEFIIGEQKPPATYIPWQTEPTKITPLYYRETITTPNSPFQPPFQVTCSEGNVKAE